MSFFPPVGQEASGARHAREQAAKQICSECSVRQECLAYALGVPEPFGIWGGLNEAERLGLSASNTS